MAAIEIRSDYLGFMWREFHSAEPGLRRLVNALRKFLIVAFLCAAASSLAQRGEQGRQGGGPGGSGVSGGSPGYSKSRGESDGTFGYTDALTWINKYAADLEKKRGAELSEVSDSLAQLQTDAQLLRQRWTEWPQKHPG